MCIFCKIVNKEIPANVVYETNTLLAMTDINPQAPTHILVIPKKHIESVMDVDADDKNLFSEIFVGIQTIAQKLGLANNGFRVVVNNGSDGGQEVPHLHYHLLGGRPLKWPPG